MRRIWAAIATAAFMALLWAGGPGQGPAGWAQTPQTPAPPPEVGTYKVINCTANKQKSEKCEQSWKDNLLHIIEDHTYWWGGYRAPYLITNGGKEIKLDCRAEWNSTLSVQDHTINFWWIEKQPKPPDKRIDLEVKGDKLAMPGVPPPSKPCGDLKGAPAVDRQITASNRRQPPQPGLYAQTAEPRTVDGELLLTVRTRTNMGPDKPPATADDIQLWDCLTTRGYPSLEVSDPGGREGQRAFVWPDGRFRALLRPGVSYDWSLLPTDCGTGRQSAGAAGRFKLDRSDPVTTREKVLLSCFVFKTRGFTDCKGWWMVHP